MIANAFLLFKSKDLLNSGILKEVVYWKVPKDLNYPQGLKYRMVLVDPVWKKVLLLFDNHAPKGPHWHDEKGIEHSYKFISVKQLESDFEKLQLSLEKKYEDNEN